MITTKTGRIKYGIYMILKINIATTFYSDGKGKK